MAELITGLQENITKISTSINSIENIESTLTQNLEAEETRAKLAESKLYTKPAGGIPLSDIVSLKSTMTPKIDGTATIGTDTKFAAGDHIHPTDTTREPAFTKNTAFNMNFGVQTNTVAEGISSYRMQKYSTSNTLLKAIADICRIYKISSADAVGRELIFHSISITDGPTTASYWTYFVDLYTAPTFTGEGTTISVTSKGDWNCFCIGDNINKKVYTCCEDSVLPNQWIDGFTNECPSARKINNKPLTTDITLTAADVGAYVKPATGIPSADLADTGVVAGTYVAVKVNSKGQVLLKDNTNQPIELTNRGGTSYNETLVSVIPTNRQAGGMYSSTGHGGTKDLAGGWTCIGLGKADGNLTGVQADGYGPDSFTPTMGRSQWNIGTTPMGDLWIGQHSFQEPGANTGLLMTRDGKLYFGNKLIAQW
jgi:hypothetical protein